MKITRDGFEFVCSTPEDIKLVLNYFKRGGAVLEDAVGARVYRVEKQKNKVHAKMHYRAWLMEEANELVRLVKAGAPFKVIKKNPLISRHTESAIYNRYYHLRRGDKERAGKVIAAAMERAGM